MGPACVHDALEPLLVHEANVGGEPDYLARLATETLETAVAAGRFDDPRPDRPLAMELASALLILAVLAWWLARDSKALEFMVPRDWRESGAFSKAG